MTSDFPVDWQTKITVHRGGGQTDPRGNPIPTTDHDIPDCLVGWRSTVDPLDRSDLTTDTAVAYCDDPMADIADGDSVTVPAGPWPSGEFQVDGKPKRWPMGLEIPLRRG